MRMRRHPRASGFTLIELVISAAIGSVILISAYACLRAGLTGQKMIDSRADAIQSARVALDLMTADLRSATPLSPDIEFLGMVRSIEGTTASNVEFGTHNYTPRAIREGDFCEMSYYLEKNADTETLSLWRRRDPSPDRERLTGGIREEIAQNVSGLRFDYYDGFEWFTSWGDAEGKYEGADTTLLDSNLYGMPEAVRIIIEFPSEELAPNTDGDDNDEEQAPTLTFQTVVRLDLAPVSYTASQASSGGQGTN